MLPSRILIVSGTRDTGVWLSQMLAQDGEDIEAVTDGALAFQRVWDVDYDVIVSELGMPGVDGRDLYMAFQNTWPELTRRMVFVCARPTEDQEIFVARTGVPLLRDPVRLVELRDAVRRVRAHPRSRVLAS